MKWKNIDCGVGCYYITGTFTEWLPLMLRDGIRHIVCEEIKRALDECSGSLLAFVLMPNHLHLLVYLRDVEQLHRLNRLWRGRSARRGIDLLKEHHEQTVLDVLAEHANGDSRYAFWKEQVRALYIVGEHKLHEKLMYIHMNPVRRGLAAEPSEWGWSSFGFYEDGRRPLLEIGPMP